MDTVLISRERDVIYLLERKGNVPETGVDALIEQLSSTKAALKASLVFDKELRGDFLKLAEETPAIEQAVFAQAISATATEQLLAAGYSVLTPDMRFRDARRCGVVLDNLIKHALKLS